MLSPLYLFPPRHPPSLSLSLSLSLSHFFLSRETRPERLDEAALLHRATRTWPDALAFSVALNAEKSLLPPPGRSTRSLESSAATKRAEGERNRFQQQRMERRTDISHERESEYLSEYARISLPATPFCPRFSTPRSLPDPPRLPSPPSLFVASRGCRRAD